jgi:DNA-binding response OmpR family regulator
MKILIIEDDLDVCKNYRSMLEVFNAEVSFCHTAEKAVHVLVNFQPDIVLLDLDLPKAAGEIVLGFIHNHPRLTNTQVIIISGQDVQTAPYIARYWNANAWLHAPVSKAQLYSAIGVVTS